MYRKFAFFLILYGFSTICGTIGRSTAAHPIDTVKINKITIASEPAYPPFCIVDKNGKADGFSVELFKAAAKAVNIEVDVKIGVWNKIKQDLAEGKIDALPFVGRTPERENIFDFSLSYVTLHGAIFVRKGDYRIKSLEQFFGKEILVMKGDNAEEFVRRNFISDKIITTNTYEEAFRALEAGEGDAVITQREMGINILNDLKIKSVEPLDIQIADFHQDFCFAVKKGNSSLMSRLNEGLSIVMANNTYDDIHFKWFGPDQKGYFSRRELITLMLYILIPLIFVIFGLSVLLLRIKVKRRTKKLHEEIEDHKRTVNLLHKQQMLLTEMERLTKVGGWEYNIRDHKFIWTDGVYSIYGVSKSEFEPSGINRDLEFYYPDDRELLDLAFRCTLETGSPFDLKLRIITSDGSLKWVHTAGQAEYMDGKITRVFGSILDITRQKQSEKELRSLKNDLELIVASRTNELEEKVEKLRRSEKAMLFMVEDLNKMTTEIRNEHQKLELVNKELEAFSYSVSHDLRTPLRALDGFTKVLSEDYYNVIDDEGRRILKIIIQNTKRMSELIDDLLSFSRLNRQELKFLEIDMQAMAGLVYKNLTENIDTSNIFFRIQKIPSAIGDPSMIKIVWENLIGNAIKFTTGKPKRIIEIGCNTEGQENIYFIKDNGAGFDMDYSEKLFGVFQRLHTDKEFEGTGIGLANVKRIILRMKGRVWAEGKINEGADFYFTLPVKTNLQPNI